MRAGKVQFTRGDKGSSRILSFGIGLILAIIGFIIMQPFFWVVLVFGQNFHYMTLPVFIMLVAFIAGFPMFIGGIFAMIFGNKGVTGTGTASYGDHDVARIRYQIEKDGMGKK